MKNIRFWLPLLAALLIATTGYALADLYINGTGDLKPWDKNQCTYYGQGFRCNLGFGRSTAVTFHSDKRKNGCALRVENKGSLFKGDRWHVEFFHTSYYTQKCGYHWTDDNTVDILEP